MSVIEPRSVQALAERLIAVPSVSPDPRAEGRCAQAIGDAFPAALERGEWRTEDGRPVVWALLRGRSKRTIVVLTHYDTVGIDEYRALPGAEPEIAFRPDVLRARLLALDPARLPAVARDDLQAERRAPGTWLFGRGALDMKSGIAAGIAALEWLAAHAASLEGSVLFLSCPDEENQSAGMLRAVPEIRALGETLELRGALNLDYVETVAAFDGVVGKRLIGLFVIGSPTHVGNPFAGADAAQLAAAIVDRVTTSAALTERVTGGVPPVALRLRDVKPRYDVQTALEAEIELNVLAFERPLASLIEILRGEVSAALADVGDRMNRLAETVHRVSTVGLPQVMTFAELPPPADGAFRGERTADPREASWSEIRRRVREASLVGPAVVIALLPPYYPQSPPRSGGLGERLRPWLERQGLGLERWYRYISDASYLAWRGDSPAELQALMPGWERDYRLPVSDSAALDLDVVTLGPWGRDAHGLFERVNRRFAFEVLPGLIAGAIREAVRE
ncbi:MAG TPA: M20/M25/M40 family metallo-hydrolase [Candidatus Eisenbacteria bacterium]|nr:M20/M25/M40 family metallo-hydrolase [Candidatus Eisenbacteria bacterium]